MLKSTRMLVLLAVAALSVPSFALALDAQAPAQTTVDQKAAKTASLRGELVKVDTEAKTIVIKAGDAMERFAYTDATEVSGAQETVSGLATRAGSPVTVHYLVDGDTRTATKIVIEPR